MYLDDFKSVISKSVLLINVFPDYKTVNSRNVLQMPITEVIICASE